jgi:hypothetical protein
MSTFNLAETHTVHNVSHELVNYNLFEQDAALQEAVVREGAAWACPELSCVWSSRGWGAISSGLPPAHENRD